MLILNVPNKETSDLEERVLLEWSAYERPHKVWSKEFFSSIIVIAFLVSVIFYFIEGLMPVFVIWALVFMGWTMSKTEPGRVTHLLTNWGLNISGKTLVYSSITNFWIESRWGSRLLRINTETAPWHMVLVLDPEIESRLREELVKRVVYSEPVPTWVDKAIQWVGQKMPLE